ncbi:MAG: SCO family protein [Gemmatimonadota bacterium]
MLGAALLAAACSSAAEDPLPALLGSLRGEVFLQPYRLPMARLPDQHGTLFDLREAARGKVTFVYFGYTHCPDICPITMATLARALQRLEPAEREQVLSVFIGVDPPRDPPEQLRSWLGAMDPTFVGLSPTFDELDAILGQLGFRRPPQDYPEEGPYEVAHPGLLYVFTPDRLGRFGYPPDALDPDVIASGVRALLGLDWRANADVEVSAARAADPLGQNQMSVYATVSNPGSLPDTLRGIVAPFARTGSLHEMTSSDGVMRMQRLDALVIPPRATVELRPGALHGMLEELAAVPAAGDTVEVLFAFARSGQIIVRVPVLDPADVVR